MIKINTYNGEDGVENVITIFVISGKLIAK